MMDVRSSKFYTLFPSTYELREPEGAYTLSYIFELEEYFLWKFKEYFQRNLMEYLWIPSLNPFSSLPDNFLKLFDQNARVLLFG